MRIWDIDPGFLNDRSLLGEHRELHGIFSILVNSRKGYSRHPETLRWRDRLPALAVRHSLLAAEMGLRGFRHHSPLAPFPEGEPIWPGIFIDTPVDQFKLLRNKYRDRPPGRIPMPDNAQQLWANHKYSVMARTPADYRRLGPLVAEKKITREHLARLLVDLLRTRPRPGRLRNAIQHLWGYVSDHSDLDPETNAPEQLLEEILRLALAMKIKYLLQSTALAELRAWLDHPQQGRD